nr:NADH dehydrogenase subunit 3 [Noterus clavicornis]
MLNLLIISFTIIMICLILIFFSKSISLKNFMDREKNSPFECGFDPKNYSRLPFSIHFFMIAVIFLIFDIEIAILFPMIMIFKTSNLINLSITSIMFIFILLLGIYHEWNQGSLNWSL